jgi:hypothetical protein
LCCLGGATFCVCDDYTLFGGPLCNVNVTNVCNAHGNVTAGDGATSAYCQCDADFASSTANCLDNGAACCSKCDGVKFGPSCNETCSAATSCNAKGTCQPNTVAGASPCACNPPYTGYNCSDCVAGAVRSADTCVCADPFILGGSACNHNASYYCNNNGKILATSSDLVPNCECTVANVVAELSSADCRVGSRCCETCVSPFHGLKCTESCTSSSDCNDRGSCSSDFSIFARKFLSMPL